MGEVLKGYLVNHYNALNNENGKNLNKSSTDLLEDHEALLKAFNDDLETILQIEDWKKCGKEEFVVLFNALKAKVTSTKNEISNFLIPAAIKAVTNVSSLLPVLVRMDELENQLAQERTNAAEYQRQLDAIPIPSATKEKYPHDAQGNRVSGPPQQVPNPDYQIALDRRRPIQENLDATNKKIATLLTNLNSYKNIADTRISEITTLNNGGSVEQAEVPQLPTIAEPVAQPVVETPVAPAPIDISALEGYDGTDLEKNPEIIKMLEQYMNQQYNLFRSGDPNYSYSQFQADLKKARAIVTSIYHGGKYDKTPLGEVMWKLDRDIWENMGQSAYEINTIIGKGHTQGNNLQTGASYADNVGLYTSFFPDGSRDNLYNHVYNMPESQQRELLNASVNLATSTVDAYFSGQITAEEGLKIINQITEDINPCGRSMDVSRDLFNSSCDIRAYILQDLKEVFQHSIEKDTNWDKITQ